MGRDFDLLPPLPGRDPLYGKHAKTLVKTNVRELDSTCERDIDLPGFQEDEIHVELKDGCLTISVSRGPDKDEQDKKGRCGGLIESPQLEGQKRQA